MVCYGIFWSGQLEVVYVLFINCFKLLGFNWLIKLPWQLCCPQTEQKSQQSLIFSSRAYSLVYRASRAWLSLICKDKRLLAVYFASEQSMNFNLSKFVYCDGIKVLHNYVRVFLTVFNRIFLDF